MRSSDGRGRRGAPQPGAWHERYSRVTGLYGRLGFCAALVDALAAGLREWAGILPQVEQDLLGKHKPVNSWGLEPELTELRMVEIRLQLAGDMALADQVGRLTRQLYSTAASLDGCYPKLTEDESAAELRLVPTARMQANALADLLLTLRRRLFRTAPEAPRPHGGCRSSTPGSSRTSGAGSLADASPRRAVRMANIEVLTREMKEHVRASADQMYAMIDLGREPVPLPRPTKAALGRRTKLPRYTVCRCFKDRSARELNLLWRLALDPEQILRYCRR